jgi:hypothetical protein
MLNSEFTIYWTVDEANGVIDLAAKVQNNGWVAFGPGKGRMVGTDPVIGFINGGQLFIFDYSISAQQLCVGGQGVCMDTVLGGTDDVQQASGVFENGYTQIKWRRRLDTGDSHDIPIVKGLMDVSFAYHPDLKALTQHLTTTRGTAKINFFTGEDAEEESSAQGLIASAVVAIILLAVSLF